MRPFLKLVIVLQVLAVLAPVAEAASGIVPERDARVDTNPICRTSQSCIELVMQAARSGNRSDELAAMARLFTLRAARDELIGRAHRPTMGGETLALGNADTAAAGVLQIAMGDLDRMAELQRPAIKALLIANKPDQAITLLHGVLASLPSATPFWLEFATALAAAGRDDSAVSALVVAHSWAHGPALLLQAYRKAAQESGPMHDLYGQAVETIKAHAVARERREAVAPLAADPSMRPWADMRSCAKPIWPSPSLRFEESGTVNLMFLVDAAGQVVDAKVLQSSGHFELDHAALAGMSQCRFGQPKGGDPAALRQTRMQYVWTLE